MGEPRRDAGLRQEPPLEALLLGVGDREEEADDLEGDLSVQRGIVGFVNDAHHAPAELPADLVTADRLGDAFLSHGLGARDSIPTTVRPGEAPAGRGAVRGG